jgi:hypothetical protein
LKLGAAELVFDLPAGGVAVLEVLSFLADGGSIIGAADDFFPRRQGNAADQQQQAKGDQQKWNSGGSKPSRWKWSSESQGTPPLALDDGGLIAFMQKSSFPHNCKSQIANRKWTAKVRCAPRVS